MSMPTLLAICIFALVGIFMAAGIWFILSNGPNSQATTRRRKRDRSSRNTNGTSTPPEGGGMSAGR